MPDNDWSVMAVIDIRGASAPTGWTVPAGQSSIAARRCRWDKVHLIRHTEFEAVQLAVFKKSNGTAPFKDTLDGNDCYGVLEDGGNLYISKCNESGLIDAKVIEYMPVIGSNPLIQDWSDKLNQVPLLGLVSPDSNPTTSMLSDASALDTDDIPLSV